MVETKPEIEPATRKDKYDIVKRMTIIGRGGCGKTSILQRLIYSNFSEEIPATPIESESLDYVMNGKNINLKIFDTSGQEDYSRFRALTLPVSDYILICFSVDDPLSYSEVFDTIHYMVKDKMPAGAKILLCATKIDMRNANSITQDEGRALGEQIGVTRYFECSAKTGVGISEIFDCIKSDIYTTEIQPLNSNSSGFFGFFSSLFKCC